MAKVTKITDKMKYISSIQVNENEGHQEKEKLLNLIGDMLKTQKFEVARAGHVLYVGQHDSGQYLNELHLRCLLDDRREVYGKTISPPKCNLYDENFTLSPEAQKLFEGRAEKKKKAGIW